MNLDISEVVAKAKGQILDKPVTTGWPSLDKESLENLSYISKKHLESGGQHYNSDHLLTNVDELSATIRELTSLCEKMINDIKVKDKAIEQAARKKTCLSCLRSKDPTPYPERCIAHLLDKAIYELEKEALQDGS